MRCGVGYRDARYLKMNSMSKLLGFDLKNFGCSSVRPSVHSPIAPLSISLVNLRNF